MTADTAFKFYRAYKFYYQGKYNFTKYGGGMPTPPLINQGDRRFYYRIAQKLTDAQIHALYTTTFFFTPNAYVADIVTPEAFSEAVRYAARPENGQTLLENDLYELSKHLRTVSVDEWLYGEWIGHQRTAMPECLQMVINKTLPLDLACILLLVPREELGYHWVPDMKSSQGYGLGPGEWITRLYCADQLFRLQRPGWRQMAWDLSLKFWQEISGGNSLTVVQHMSANALDI